MQRDVVSVAHSHAAVRGRTEEDAVPPCCRTPTRPHRSMDVDSTAVEFFHVQLIRAEGIPTECCLAPWSIRSIAVFGRNVVFLPNRRCERSGRSHMPVTADYHATGEQNGWILITLVLAENGQRPLRVLGVVND